MDKKSLEEIKKELEDIKALLVLYLQNEKISNKDIGKAMGVSPGKVSQLIDKKKYPRK